MKTISITLILLGFAVLVQAAPPPWVETYSHHPLLGSKHDEDIVLSEQIKITFNDKSNRTLFNYRRTVLNGGKGNFADLSYSYPFDGGGDFKTERIWIIKPDGSIDKAAKDVFKTRSAFSTQILYSDNMVAEWFVNNLLVGSIVVIEYSYEIKELLDFGKLYLQEDTERDSTIIDFVVPETCRLTVKPMNTDQRVVLGQASVRAGKYPKWEDKPYSGGYEVAAPHIQFEFSALRDSIRSWPQVTSEIQSFWSSVRPTIDTTKYSVVPADSSREAVATFLKKFEQDFRYVGIEIGKGSFIPHEPNKVLSARYGDCKDLSYFLASYLNGYHIRTYPVLLKIPSQSGFQPDCASRRQFNHAITVLLIGQDTIYYDPTTKGYSLGTLPWADQGSYALWLKTGSTLINLPRDTIPLQYHRELHGSLKSDGQVTGRLEIKFDHRIPNSERSNSGEKNIRESIRDMIREDIAVTVGAITWADSSSSMYAEVTLKNYVKRVGSQQYCVLYPFVSSSRDSVGAGAPQGYYFPRPSLHDDVVSLQIPDNLDLPERKDEQVILGSGQAVFIADSANSTLTASWKSVFHESFYPSEKKSELDSLVHAIHTQRGMRVKFCEKSK